MAWGSTPRTWAAGLRVTAAILNADIRDKLLALSGHTHTGADGDGSASLAPTRVTMGAGALLLSKGTDVASASPLALPNPLTGNFYHVTGTTGFSAITPNVQAGTPLFLVFDSSLTLVHNATTMILQTGVNWVVPAGAMIMLVSEGSGNWREVTRWFPTAGSALTPASITMSGPIYQSQGSNVASANSITLGVGGDFFEVTGTTQINLINAAGMRQAGSVVHLYFSGALTLHHAQGTTGQLFLAGSTDWTVPAGSTITLVSDGSLWRELARTAA